ncbi:hypothetical protein E4U02_05220 [Microbacterium paludicola]|uniref:Uncharacterized protein n=1 Tax=Microbacterium paludicola TaxID=300019 RepID=A0A4Y9FZF7_9MICO|nr:hypothetical protein [Microbacterium paludicola]MBF0815805.1 hypothetical protein [Microbacterium paludicola]TFU33633.1 hypothetical protein E4U02_05220 [Microbacterium paludicola]
MSARSAATAPRWRWILFALVVGLVVLVLTGTSYGACYDSPDPALSRCESGPLLGVAGVWVAWGLYGVFAVFCLRRALSRTRVR